MKILMTPFLDRFYLFTFFFAACKLLCYHGRNLFVCVSRIAKPSRGNWVGVYEGGRSIQRPLLFSVHVIFFNSLPARVGCSFQGKLFSIFKLLCLVFVRYYFFLPARPSRTVYTLLLHLDPQEKISSPIQDLFCSRKPLTYTGSASVQCGLHGRTDYPLSQALTFFTLDECKLLDSTVIT